MTTPNQQSIPEDVFKNHMECSKTRVAFREYYDLFVGRVLDPKRWKISEQYPGRTLGTDAEEVIARTMHPSESHDVSWSHMCADDDGDFDKFYTKVLGKDFGLFPPIDRTELYKLVEKHLSVWPEEYDAAYESLVSEAMSSVLLRNTTVTRQQLHKDGIERVAHLFPGVGQYDPRLLKVLLKDIQTRDQYEDSEAMQHGQNNNRFKVWSTKNVVLWLVICRSHEAAEELLLEQEEIIHSSQSWSGVYAVVVGACSDKVWGEVCGSLVSTMKSAIKSLAYATTPQPHPRMIDEQIGIMSYATDTEVWPDYLVDNIRFITHWVKAAFAEWESSDTHAKRIRNAVHYLVESDRQEHYETSVLLCVSAIEALLGGNTSEMTKTLAERVASLLEPDPNYRVAAEDFMVKIYKYRSRVVHGDVIDGERRYLEEARVLASALLKVYWERADAQEKLDINEKPRHFFDEVRNEKHRSGVRALTTPSVVRGLWHGPPPNDEDYMVF